MHTQTHKFVSLILSDESSVILAVLAFFLMGLYIIQIRLTPSNFVINKGVRKNRLIMRALNWGIFGTIFLLFGNITPIPDILVWRATARIALVFLMLPEMAYQITVIWPAIKGKIWTRTSPQSS
jgi:hypothetical protein